LIEVEVKMDEKKREREREGRDKGTASRILMNTQNQAAATPRGLPSSGHSRNVTEGTAKRTRE
jgi:hypothetical protein